ncbi:MAG TPA: sigma 54-interacting transcriptional regulator, partial [Nitrospirota bacterium]|nr:sigma 54-interacting transcriptional regulator [Nitrospirota bacterium]
MAQILVIDDEESIRYTFASFLSEEGHAVTVARNFSEGLARLSEKGFDLIFSDIVLGGRTGMDILREAKERNPACPVVMITGFPTVETAAEAVRLGAFDYLPKPVEQEALLRITRLALEHNNVLRENEKYRAHLDAVFRSVEDGILTVDKELTVLEMNDAVGKICGLSRDEVGLNLASSSMHCKERFLRALKETVEGRKSVRMERFECGPAAGPPKTVTFSTYPLIDRQGLFHGAVLVLRDETRLASLEINLRERSRFHNLIGIGERMQKVYSLIESLADVETTVLITGDSGTGKELVAEALHFMGSRRGRPLVKVNCSALSENLLESELFGHVKGAFTGAVSDRIGRFQKADGGSLFLDEIGDVSPRVQASLLRVLQTKEFERVGDSKPIKVDVRVIVATNKDLLEQVKRGEFREDLYYRLKVVEVFLPPLRDRREDIPVLVAHFLEQFNKQFHKAIGTVSADVEKIFLNYPWPGNVRELKHAIEHSFILCRGDTITADHLPHHLIASWEAGDSPRPAGGNIDAQTILQALEKTAGNKARAARLLG